MGRRWSSLYVLVLHSHWMQALLGRNNAAQVDPEEAISWRLLLTTLPATRRHILSWGAVRVVHLCICHTLKRATTQTSINWRKVKLYCVTWHICNSPTFLVHLGDLSLLGHPIFVNTWFGQSLKSSPSSECVVLICISLITNDVAHRLIFTYVIMYMAHTYKPMIHIKLIFVYIGGSLVV